MSEIKALILKNDLGIDEEKKAQLLRQASVGNLSYLSPEREAGPFMLFCCGEDLPAISAKTNVPMDILLVTAMHYKWMDKAGIIRQDPSEIQKSLANSVLVATWIAAKEQLAEVIAGKRKAKDCSFIPTNPAQLEKLMNFVSAANGLEPKDQSKQSPMQITAENVQINQNTPQVLPESTDKGKESDEERDAKLKRLEGLSKA